MAVVVGIALCSAYLTGTLALVAGLRAGAQVVASGLPNPPLLVYGGPDLEGSTIDPADIKGLEGPLARFRIAPASLTFGGSYVYETYAVAVQDPKDVTLLAQWSLTSGDEGALGPDLWEDVGAAGIDPSHPVVDGIPITATPYGEQTLFPNDWVIVSGDLMERLHGPAAPSFLVLPAGTDADTLAAKGYTVVPAAGSLGFLRGAVEEAARALLGLVIATSAATLLLVSSLLALEVRYRAADLRLVASFGASRGLVAGLVLGQALYVALFGTFLGMALGIMAAHGLASFAPYFGLTNILRPRVGPEVILLGLVLVPSSGLMGGLAGMAALRRRGSQGVSA